VEYHNPSQLLEHIQLVQEAVPLTEILRSVQIFQATSGATGQQGGDFIVPDGDDTPTGLSGVAMIIWAAQAECGTIAAAQAGFSLNDESGVVICRLATEGPQGATRAVATGDFIVLVKTPLVLPPKTRLLAVSTTNCSWTLNYFFSILQRGEPLPQF